MQQEGKYCVCSAPCVRVMYEPSLSYAQISKFNVQKMMLPRPEQSERVFGKFIKSREVSQVVVAETRTADLIQIYKIVSITKRYERLLNKSYSILLNDTYVMEKYGVLFPEEAIAITVNFIMNNFFNSIHIKDNKKFHIVNDVQEAYKELASNLINSSHPFISLNGGISDVFSPWENCLNKNITSTSCDETEYGTELNFKISGALQLSSIDVKTYTDHIGRVKIAYMEHVEQLFSNTSYDVTENVNHHKCLDAIENVNRSVYDHIVLIKTESNKYLNMSSIPEQLNSSKTIYYSFIAIAELLDSTIIEECTWFTLVEDWSVMNDIIMPLMGLQQNVADIKSMKTTIDRLTETLLNKYLKTIELSNTLEVFLSTNITKTELAVYVDRFPTIQLIADILMLQTEISHNSEKLMKSLKKVNHTISVLCDQLFAFKLPVMDDSIINSMPLIIYARNSANNNDINEWLARMRENRGWYFKSVSTGMLGIHYDYINEATSIMYNYGKRFTSAMTDIMENIAAFKNGNKMDTSFFM